MQAGRAAAAWMLVLTMSTAAQGGSRKDLEDVIPSLYGGDGITLMDVTRAGFEHSPHFAASTLRELNNLNGEIKSSLGLVSLNSAVAGYTFDLELGVPVRSEDTLGPILSERARTLGAKRLNVGFTFSRTRYRLFEGDRIGDLQLVFPHEDSNGDGVIGPNPSLNPPFLRDFEFDFIRVELDLEIRQKVYGLLMTYGVTDTLDVGIAIPVVDASVKAQAVGRVVNLGTNPPSDEFHVFDPDEDDRISNAKGSKTGIGDVLLRVKKQLVRDHDRGLPDFALVGQAKLPTGDDANFHGTGDLRLLTMLVFSKRYGRFGGHVNTGWEWVEGASDQNNARYAVGFDVRVHDRVTFVTDVLGRWEHKGDGIGDHVSDVALGAKLNLWRSLLLTTNFILPLNRTSGLRADFIPTIGFEYLFGGDG